MKRALLIALLFAVAGCGATSDTETRAGQSDTRQKPSNYEPGVHINGYANVGVVRNF